MSDYSPVDILSHHSVVVIHMVLQYLDMRLVGLVDKLGKCGHTHSKKLLLVFLNSCLITSLHTLVYRVKEIQVCSSKIHSRHNI